MVNCNMIQNDGDEVVDGPVVSEGGRSPSTLSPGQSAPATRGGAALGPLAPNQRWRAARKREGGLRLMRAERGGGCGGGGAGKRPSCSRASSACRCSSSSNGGRRPKPRWRGP